MWLTPHLFLALVVVCCCWPHLAICQGEPPADFEDGPRASPPPTVKMHKLRKSQSLEEALQNRLVLVLDNNVELAEEIVMALDAFPGFSQSRALATAYLGAPYPRITSGPILLEPHGNKIDRADIRSQLAQVRAVEWDSHSSNKFNFLHAILASYLDDLHDTFKYFVVAPGGRRVTTVPCPGTRTFLKCCPTCCPRCQCSPEGNSSVAHLERASFTGTPAPAVNPPPPTANSSSTTDDDWWQSLEDLYPHKSVYGEREDLLVKYLAGQAKWRFSSSDQRAYEQWMRVLASLGEPLSRATYLAARNNETGGGAMDARTIKVKLFSHLTRWARRHYLGPERGEPRECIATRSLCVAPDDKCPPRPEQCTGCASCDAWRCPRPPSGPPPPSPTTSGNHTTRIEPDLELIPRRQATGDSTCGWAPLNRLGGRTRSRDGWPASWPQPPPATTRVINGQPQMYGEFPSYVFLVINNRFTCGGTLISARHVLTAGHCVSVGRSATTVVQPGAIRIFMGEHVRMKPDVYEYEARVARVCRAPEYWTDGRGGETRHDWAILELKQPARFNEYVQTACLPRGALTPPTRGDDSNCWLAGFGLIGYKNGIVGDATGIMPSVLQKIQLEQVSCRPWDVQPLDKSRICFGRPDSQRGGSCRGDSGGPVLCQDRKTKRWAIMAVVSYGTSDCDVGPGQPVLSAVYADVLKQLAGIEKCMKG